MNDIAVALTAHPVVLEDLVRATSPLPRLVAPHGFEGKLHAPLEQPLPLGADAPVVLTGDPRLHIRRMSGWESFAGALTALGGYKGGETGTAYPKLLGGLCSRYGVLVLLILHGA